VESEFKIGDQWTISWLDEDYLEISGPNDQHCIMCAGDFESMLSALCASYNEGTK